MPIKHVVKQGECLSSIAKKYGHYVPTIWDDPVNEAVRELRKNPNVLLPNDVIVVPDLRRKEVPCATGATHTFRRRGVPEKFLLQLLDAEERPRAAVPYVFEVGDKRTATKTNAEGWVDEWIEPDQEKAVLLIGDPVEEEMEIRFGALDPADVESGARARLFSLGYLDDENAGADLYLAALGTFQADYAEKVTMELDAVTVNLLREVYGS